MGLFDKLFKKEEEVSLPALENVSDEDIVAIADGEIIDIATVSDPVFAEQMMGKSTAFKYEGKVPDIPLGLTDDSENDAQTGKLKNAELYLYYNRDNRQRNSYEKIHQEVFIIFIGASSDFECCRL